MMFDLQTTMTMELLLLVFPLICFEVTFGDRSEPVVIKVEEGSDVILPCSLSSKESVEFKRFDWKKDALKEVFVYDVSSHTNKGRPGQDDQFKGRVSHFEDELNSGNASITIRKTNVADSGDYTCDFPQLQARQTFHIKLVVGGILKDRTIPDGNIPGAATKPYITTLKQTENWALLQCEVRGAFPKPELNWQDGAGNNLQAEEPKVTERGGRYDIILNITVTKTDRYRCVATQEEIRHQIDAQTHVFISGLNVAPRTIEGFSTGLVVGWIAVVLLVIGLVYFIYQNYKKDGILRDGTAENIRGSSGGVLHKNSKDSFLVQDDKV